MQRAYTGKLLEIAQNDDRVIELLADSGTNLDEMFKRYFPGRLYNVGIAEQNALGLAAGMSLTGIIPFVYLQGAFIAYRAMEFIRNDICFHNANVKLIGQGSGISLSGLGPSHHTTEDIGVLRCIPNLSIYSPATPLQVGQCTEAVYKINGPCYLKIGMNNEAEFFEKEYQLPDCGFDTWDYGKDVLIVSTGSILEEVIPAAEMIREKGIGVTVINLFKIKPFDEKRIIEMIETINPRKIITIEEHQVQNGIAGMISESLVSAGLLFPLQRIGFEDRFAKGYAPNLKELRKENGLDSESIAGRILNEIN